ncbi:MAG: hypothetical protein QGG19_21925 [Alphaproteobacteria bacterium]|nr:hypothetical protein [Alphaproteobacteria bacterium]MDP6256346.1 hypothetical protein [Alphaproteobacteria bacterium]MDP7053049.1 hypothetical protein [Alphaproteobacteria bacterium]MDP7230864.1 hypothetical protein [Alphaproteobacteria bacterium]MDP7460233.1 hypothetical protein [Alphaproteobacteria bacterium]
MKRILRALSVTIFAAGFGVVMASPVGAEMSAAKQRQAAMKAIGEGPWRVGHGQGYLFRGDTGACPGYS